MGSPSRSWRMTQAAIVSGSSPGSVETCAICDRSTAMMRCGSSCGRTVRLRILRSRRSAAAWRRAQPRSDVAGADEPVPGRRRSRPTSRRRARGRPSAESMCRTSQPKFWPKKPVTNVSGRKNVATIVRTFTISLSRLETAERRGRARSRRCRGRCRAGCETTTRSVVDVAQGVVRRRARGSPGRGLEQVAAAGRASSRWASTTCCSRTSAVLERAAAAGAARAAGRSSAELLERGRPRRRSASSAGSKRRASASSTR